MTVEHDHFLGWPSLRMRTGQVSLQLVPSIGGRVMGLAWGDDELAFVNHDLAGTLPERDTLSTPSFPLWGGDKTWLSPQQAWPHAVPPPVLDSQPYAVDVSDGAVTMTSDVCPLTGMQIRRTVSFTQTPDQWRVEHTVINRGTQPRTCAPWGVSMLLRPARVFLPLNASSTHPGGIKTFAEEGVSAAVREQVVSVDADVVQIDCLGEDKFKFGTDAANAVIVTELLRASGSLIHVKRLLDGDESCHFAHGCSTEVFNSEDFPYFEAEVHPELRTLSAGESATVIEELALYRAERAPDVRDLLHSK